MKKAIIVLLLLLAIFFAPSPVNAQISSDDGPSDIELMQLKSIATYKQILQFSKEYLTFEDEFGGAYLDSSGNLVINVVEGNKKNFCDVLEIPSDVIVNEVRYSFRELKETQSLIEKHMYEYDIASIYSSEKTNMIVIDLRDNYEENFFHIKELAKIDNLDINYVGADANKALTANYYVTNGNYFSSNGFNFTAGFDAKNSSGKDGVVTAGHIQFDVEYGDEIYYGGSIAGYRKQSVFGGSADASFIELKDTLFTHWHSTHNLIGNKYYTAVGLDPEYLLVGLSIDKFGGRTGETTGSIIATDVSETFYIEGVYYTISHTVRTNYMSLKGDSGGPITYWVWTGGTSIARFVMGIQSYALLDENDEWVDGTSYSGFTRVDYIKSALNITFD